jgi:hypothetical protein
LEKVSRRLWNDHQIWLIINSCTQSARILLNKIPLTVVFIPMRRAKKITLTVVLLITSVRLFAPTGDYVVIGQQAPINPYRQLIFAIGKVETDLDTMAYNPVEDAVGFFQIRPIRLNDYNKRTSSSYKMKDLYNYKISEKIFLYYCVNAQSHNLETIAKSWNGSGSRTIEYWKKVKEHL